MPILDFARRHIFVSIGLIVGAFITVGGWIMDILDLAALGLPNQTWNIVGALIFFGSVTAMLYGHDQKMEGIAKAATVHGSVGAAAAIDFEPPDYSIWDMNDKMTVFQTACLWAESSPPPTFGGLNMLPNAVAIYTMLSNAITDGTLSAYERRATGDLLRTKEISLRNLLKREDLVAFASKRGQQPKFLFPEKRSNRI